MKLIAYSKARTPGLRIRPAQAESEIKHGLKEKSLSAAGAYGWELLNTRSFWTIWNGGANLEDIKITFEDGSPATRLVVSHFGYGVLTFHIPFIFRTDPGYNLWVSGAVNRPKDGIIPLTGIIEYDWAPMSFTMNWLFTAPNILVKFEPGEPICCLFPIPRGLVDRQEPRMEKATARPQPSKSASARHRPPAEFKNFLGRRKP